MNELNIVKEEIQNAKLRAESASKRAENAEKKFQEYIQSRSIRFQVRKQLKSLKEQGLKVRVRKLIKKILKKPLKFSLKILLKNTQIRYFLLNVIPIHWANRIRNNILGEFSGREIHINELPEYAISFAEDLSNLRRS